MICAGLVLDLVKKKHSDALTNYVVVQPGILLLDNVMEIASVENESIRRPWDLCYIALGLASIGACVGHTLWTHAEHLGCTRVRWRWER
jgi:hypothetical protein